LFVSNRDWLRQRLLAKLRSVNQAVANDAALKHLADNAARRVSRPGGGYGEIESTLSSVSKLIETLAAVDRGVKKGPMTAAELRRLHEAGMLPRLPPWF
jgi:hypothetical protein